MRPTKLTPKVVERIVKAVSLGLSYDEVARAAGTHPSTFYLSIIIIGPGLDLGPDRPQAHAGERGQRAREGAEDELLGVSFIIIDPAGMVPLVALRRTKKSGSARAGTCRDHAINGPRSWTTQSRGTPAIDAQRLNWLRRRRAIRGGGEAHPLAATRRLLRSVMVGA